MDFVAFTIDSLEMGSTAFNDDIWRTHYLLLNEGSTAFTHDICYIFSLLLFPVARIQHRRSQYILKRDDVQHLLKKDGVHNIYS